jgi:hypothetical protein
MQLIMLWRIILVPVKRAEISAICEGDGDELGFDRILSAAGIRRACGGQESHVRSGSTGSPGTRNSILRIVPPLGSASGRGRPGKRRDHALRPHHLLLARPRMTCVIRCTNPLLSARCEWPESWTRSRTGKRSSRHVNSCQTVPASSGRADESSVASAARVSTCRRVKLRNSYNCGMADDARWLIVRRCRSR